MATNKNAVLRYKILDSCFSNFYKKYFIDDLIKICSEKLSDHFGYEVSVSRRTILDDIKFMKSLAGYDAPILSVQDGKKVYYQYEDHDFSILKKPLSTKEIENLKKIEKEKSLLLSEISALETRILDNEEAKKQLKSSLCPFLQETCKNLQGQDIEGFFEEKDKNFKIILLNRKNSLAEKENCFREDVDCFFISTGGWLDHSWIQK